MTVARDVGSEDANLAVRDFACGTRVLPRYPARRLYKEERLTVRKRGGRKRALGCKIACNIDPLRGLFASNSDPL